jgi:ATP-dependent helicase HepA
MLSITLNKKVKGVLEDVITPLGTYLKTNLQAISNNWWEDIVLNCLTESQLKNIQGRKITTVYELDLAALIRTFDSNWNLISQRQEILPEFRNILREMRSVRNRWSHAGASSYPKEDIFRDLDTLNRFAKEIGADTSFLNNIKELMSELLTEFSGPVKSKPVDLNPKIKVLLPKYKKEDLDRP